ncbi:FliO/MopB family protein [Phycisphaerales bacterium AB-hyl4]|uniref:FliO/MopB family protein n=1 Tax=Natronomicrosphaera hydrolytica TaxID=3242702 RepID=A0ABV4U662_9BACT
MEGRTVHAWNYSLALAVALLISSAAVLADAPARPASANDGAAMSVDADTQADTNTRDDNADNAAPARRDLSDLARSLAERRNTASTDDRDADDRAAPARQSILAPTDNDESSDTADAAAASREDESLGTPSTRTSEGGSSGVFSGTGSATLNTLTALGIVIGLILFLRWAWTKLSGQPTVRPSPVIEVLARTPVAPRNHILIVRIGNRVLIVGDSANGLRTLANVDDPEEIADLLTAVTASRETSVTKGFSQLLGRFHGDYDAPTADADGVGSPTDFRFDDEGGDRSEHLVDRARDSVSSLMSRLRVMSGKGGDS